MNAQQHRHFLWLIGQRLLSHVAYFISSFELKEITYKALSHCCKRCLISSSIILSLTILYMLFSSYNRPIGTNWHKGEDHNGGQEGTQKIIKHHFFGLASTIYTFPCFVYYWPVNKILGVWKMMYLFNGTVNLYTNRPVKWLLWNMTVCANKSGWSFLIKCKQHHVGSLSQWHLPTKAKWVKPCKLLHYLQKNWVDLAH